MNQFSGWIASLSNGDTIFEQEPVPGEFSSWQKLLGTLTDSLQITQLRLARSGRLITCDSRKKIDGFCMAYEVTKVVFRGNETKVQGVGSVYKDVVFMTWVDDYGNVRHDIRPLSEMRMHTTLRNTYAETKEGAK